MRRRSVWFVGPRQLEVRQEDLRTPLADEVLVQVEVSGISSGTEMLVYRGELPDAYAQDVDPVIKGLRYPTPFGYCAVGRVKELGLDVDPSMQDRLVFAFQPHTSAYVAAAASLVTVPDGISAQDAVFLANTETAVNLIHDAAPLMGERVLVLGQGTVGLLTAALLNEFPCVSVVTADMYASRRAASKSVGVTAVLDPAHADFVSAARAHTQGAGYDVVMELTGNPGALDMAIELAAYSGRIIVGSWYGNRTAPVALGGRFHRSRISMQSSQVSTIAPGLTGRWDKARRFGVAWEALGRIRPQRWITQRFHVQDAADAFRLLDLEPKTAIQVILEYPTAD